MSRPAPASSTATPPAEQVGREHSVEPTAAGRVVRAAIWLPGLLVAIGAAVATAHGLYEVALAARVPGPIAWLYPLITDGLALVAYAATARLQGSACRYAWAVVVLAAGLSGLAQAAFLAGDPPPAPMGPAELGHGGGGVQFEAPPALRFGVGAWPAVAAAIVAHLLYLLAESSRPLPATGGPSTGIEPLAGEEVSSAGPASDAARPASGRTAVQPVAVSASYAQAVPEGVQAPAELAPAAPTGKADSSGTPVTVFGRPAPVPSRSSVRSSGSPQSDRARATAVRLARTTGSLPTVSQLMAQADVSRGTAGEVLKTLRDQPAALHVVNGTTEVLLNRTENGHQP